MDQELKDLNTEQTNFVKTKTDEIREDREKCKEEVVDIAEEGKEYLRDKASVIHELKNNIMLNTHTLREIHFMKNKGKQQIVDSVR